jgi:hypothetical protein
MGSLPKPAHLEIRIDEWRVAQQNIDAVDVELEWRGAHKDTALAELLAALPPRTDFVPIRLADGRTELAYAAWKRIRFGRGRWIFELARYDYESWAGGPVDRLAQDRKRLTEMVRRYIPDFDEYTDKQQVDFLIRTQQKLNTIRDSAEAALVHLEYAAPDRNKATPWRKDPLLYVRAAVFSDVISNSCRVGELLGIPPSPSDAVRNQNQNVRTKAKWGRELLHTYFGETEWKIKVERIRKYRRWWEQFESLLYSPKEQIYFLLAKARGTSLEHERLIAEGDGFDRKLDEWIAVVESRFRLEEKLDHWDDPHKGNAEWTAVENERRTIQSEQFRIQATDERFNKALSVFEALPVSQP